MHFIFTVTLNILVTKIRTIIATIENDDAIFAHRSLAGIYCSTTPVIGLTRVVRTLRLKSGRGSSKSVPPFPPSNKSNVSHSY